MKTRKLKIYESKDNMTFTVDRKGDSYVIDKFFDVGGISLVVPTSITNIRKYHRKQKK